MRRLVVRAQAELEIAAAIDWYQERNAVAAGDFATVLDRILKTIEENPFQYQAIEGEIRRALMPALPYWIVYLVTETDIVVVSCVNTSQDPKVWRERIR